MGLYSEWLFPILRRHREPVAMSRKALSLLAMGMVLPIIMLSEPGRAET